MSLIKICEAAALHRYVQMVRDKSLPLTRLTSERGEKSDANAAAGVPFKRFNGLFKQHGMH